MNLLTFKAIGYSESKTKTVVETSNFKLVIDEPASLGGTNKGPNPVEFMLAALAGCLNVVGNLVASEMKFNISSLKINLEGDLDPNKFIGKSDEKRAGYQEIRVKLDIKSDADSETLEKWVSEVERRCPVSDNIANATPVKISLS